MKARNAPSFRIPRPNEWFRKAFVVICGLVIVALLACPLAIVLLLSNAGHGPLKAAASTHKAFEYIQADNSVPTVYWIQSLVAWVTLVVTAVAGSQLVLINSQVRHDKKRAEADAYRILIRPDMQSIKRFIRLPEVETEILSLGAILSGPRLARAQYDAELDRIRKSIDSIGSRTPMPLMGETRLSFDHIEMLINEYEYLAKRLSDGSLSRKFATEMAQQNFISVYGILENVLKLRRAMSPRYASAFWALFNRKR